MAQRRPARDAETSRAPNGDRAAAAAYLATLTADLAIIARRHDLDVIGYLLDMARLEAENTAQGAEQI